MPSVEELLADIPAKTEAPDVNALLADIPTVGADLVGDIPPKTPLMQTTAPAESGPGLPPPQTLSAGPGPMGPIQAPNAPLLSHLGPLNAPLPGLPQGLLGGAALAGRVAALPLTAPIEAEQWGERVLGRAIYDEDKPIGDILGKAIAEQGGKAGHPWMGATAGFILSEAGPQLAGWMGGKYLGKLAAMDKSLSEIMQEFDQKPSVAPNLPSVAPTLPLTGARQLTAPGTGDLFNEAGQPIQQTETGWVSNIPSTLETRADHPNFQAMKAMKQGLTDADPARGADIPLVSKAEAQQITKELGPREAPQDPLPAAKLEGTVSPVKNPGVSQYVASAQYVFKDTGIWDTIGRPLTDAADEIRTKVGAQRDVVRGWQQLVGGADKKTSQLLWDLASNSLAEEDLAKITPEMRQVADKWKGTAKQYAEGQGVVVDDQIKDYIPHLLNEQGKAVVQVMKNAGLAGDMPQELAGLTRYITPTEGFNPFLLERKGFPLVEKNFWRSVDAYSTVAERTMVQDRVLQEIKPHIEQLPGDLKAYVNDFLHYQFLGKVHAADRAVAETLKPFLDLLGTSDVAVGATTVKVPNSMLWPITRRFTGPAPLSAVVGAYRDMGYLSLIGGSLTTAIKHITQPLTAIARLRGGPLAAAADAGAGYLDAARLIFRPSVWQEMKRMNLVPDMAELLEGTTPAWRSMMDTAKDGLYVMMRSMQMWNRLGTARMGARNLLRNIQPEELMQFGGPQQAQIEKEFADLVKADPKVFGAYNMLDRTLSDLVNFKYGTNTQPLVFAKAGPIGRVALQFQTFGQKFTEQMASYAQDMKPFELPKDFVQHPIETLRQLKDEDRGTLLRSLVLMGSVASVTNWPWLFHGLLIRMSPGLSLAGAVLRHGPFSVEVGKELENLVPLRSAYKQVERLATGQPLFKEKP